MEYARQIGDLPSRVLHFTAD